jgi:hypothetical protein
MKSTAGARDAATAEDRTWAEAMRTRGLIFSPSMVELGKKRTSVMSVAARYGYNQ